jgi:hypothetical protein
MTLSLSESGHDLRRCQDSNAGFRSDKTKKYDVRYDTNVTTEAAITELNLQFIRTTVCPMKLYDTSYKSLI